MSYSAEVVEYSDEVVEEPAEVYRDQSSSHRSAASGSEEQANERRYCCRCCGLENLPLTYCSLFWTIIASTAVSFIWIYKVSWEERTARTLAGLVITTQTTDEIAVISGSITGLAFLVGMYGMCRYSKKYLFLFIMIQISVPSNQNFMFTLYREDDIKTNNIRFWTMAVWLCSALVVCFAFRINSYQRLSKEKQRVEIVTQFFICVFTTSAILIIAVSILSTYLYEIMMSDFEAPDRTSMEWLLIGAISLCILSIFFFIIGITWKFDRLLIIASATVAWAASIAFGYTAPWLTLTRGYYEKNGNEEQKEVIGWVVFSAFFVWIASIFHGWACLIFCESLRGWLPGRGVMTDLSTPYEICYREVADPIECYTNSLRGFSILLMIFSSLLFLVGFLSENRKDQMDDTIDDFSESRMRTLLWIGAGVMMTSGILNSFCVTVKDKFRGRLNLAILFNCYNFGYSYKSAMQIFSLYFKQDTWGWGYDTISIDDTVFGDLFLITGFCYALSAVISLITNLFSLFLKESFDDEDILHVVDEMEEDNDAKIFQPGMGENRL